MKVISSVKEWNEWFYANIGGMYCCGPNVILFTGPKLSPAPGNCGVTFPDSGTPVEVRDTVEVEVNAAKCDDDYPHKCPFCGNAAYIGVRKIDCKAQCEDSR